MSLLSLRANARRGVLRAVRGGRSRPARCPLRLHLRWEGRADDGCDVTTNGGPPSSTVAGARLVQCPSRAVSEHAQAPPLSFMHTRASPRWSRRSRVRRCRCRCCARRCCCCRRWRMFACAASFPSPNIAMIQCHLLFSFSSVGDTRVSSVLASLADVGECAATRKRKSAVSRERHQYMHSHINKDSFSQSVSSCIKAAAAHGPDA